MNTTKLIAGCALLAGVSAVFAQNIAGVEPRNIVQLSTNGSVEVAQDWLTLTLTVAKDGTDPNAVQQQVRQALEAALVEPKKQALPGALDVRTGQFSLQPRYGRDGKINGWQGSSELVLEGRDFARIGAAAAKQQTMVLANTQFSLSREARNKVEAQAQGQAITSFKAKATEIAQSFGFTGYQLRDIAVNIADQGIGPRTRMVAMEAKSFVSDAPVPMEAGKSLVVVNVSGSVQMK